MSMRRLASCITRWKRWINCKAKMDYKDSTPYDVPPLTRGVRFVMVRLQRLGLLNLLLWLAEGGILMAESLRGVRGVLGHLSTLR